MFAPNALVSTTSSPLTAAKVCSLHRSCRAREKIRKPVFGMTLFTAQNNNNNNNSRNISFYASDNASDTKAADHL